MDEEDINETNFREITSNGKGSNEVDIKEEGIREEGDIKEEEEDKLTFGERSGKEETEVKLMLTEILCTGWNNKSQKLREVRRYKPRVGDRARRQH